MRQRSLAMTVDVSDQDIQAADQLLDNLLGADHKIVITHDVLFAFENRYGKSFFVLLGEALAGEILKPGTKVIIDIYALADDYLHQLQTAIENNPYQSHRLSLELAGFNRYADDDLEIGGKGPYSYFIKRFEAICALQGRQNRNRVRIGFYHLQQGLFNVIRMPRDVQALILNEVANSNDMPQRRNAHAVVDQLNQIRRNELSRRAGNGK